MRPDSLRACTKQAAQKENKLNSRLSPGEKKDRKRMAQVAAVYTVQAHIRTGESIMKVSEEAFLEAQQRDPRQEREWVVLIDGLPHQIRLIKKEMMQLSNGLQKRR